MPYLFANPLISITAAFALVAVILGWFVFDLRRKWNALFGQGAGTDVELLREIIGRLEKTEGKIDAAGPRLAALEEIGKVAVQKVGFLRFNPFNDTGGDQSFAAAFLDGEDNGVIISSLYSREGVRVYAKEIKNGASKHSLSTEERQVLEEATN